MGNGIYYTYYWHILYVLLAYTIRIIRLHIRIHILLPWAMAKETQIMGKRDLNKWAKET